MYARLLELSARLLELSAVVSSTLHFSALVVTLSFAACYSSSWYLPPGLVDRHFRAGVRLRMLFSFVQQYCNKLCANLPLSFCTQGGHRILTTLAVDCLS
jgi:hypothetical protein